ncbi:MAG TPA: NAD(P)H-dependent oxidoreductase subunit E [bacterium]|nr:NAD(P)H-dependent oxidoreductase subunit E [bacterium]
MADKMAIELCMGSACYLRGNRENVELVKNYITTNNLDAHIVLRGELCVNDCSRGPRIKIGGTEYTGINGPALLELLDRTFAGTPA